MIKKLLLVSLMGLFVASSAIAADLGDVAFNNLNAAVTGHTSGVIVNPEGKGDALIFGYYDVRPIGGKEQETYFCIINEETGNITGGVAAKIRFREWDKSEEVFDAEIWLSIADAWCAFISRNTTSGNAKITSSDYVITEGTTTSATFTLSTPLSGGFDFFWPSGYPSASSNLMGYFEVIGSERTYPKSYGTSPIKVTRYTLAADLDVPNTLMGYAYLVRVADGVAMGYNATAFANFSRNQGSLFTGTGTTSPNLMNCEDTLDQIEFNLSKEDLFAGYDVEDFIAGKFSLVMTFPTKHHHFRGRPYYSIKTLAAADPLPYGAPWTVEHMNKPQTINIYIYDRLENKIPGNWWSPPGASAGLPYEVSILGLFKGSAPTVPASGQRDNVAASTGGYETGYLWINFPNGPTAIAGYALPHAILTFGWFGISFTQYYGLPVISLAIQEFANGAAGGYYGEILPAFFEVEWL